MTARPHYHPCLECHEPTLCTGIRDHRGPICIDCRKAFRQAQEADGKTQRVDLMQALEDSLADLKATQAKSPEH